MLSSPWLLHVNEVNSWWTICSRFLHSGSGSSPDENHSSYQSWYVLKWSFSVSSVSGDLQATPQKYLRFSRGLLLLSQWKTASWKHALVWKSLLVTSPYTSIFPTKENQGGPASTSCSPFPPWEPRRLLPPGVPHCRIILCQFFFPDIHSEMYSPCPSNCLSLITTPRTPFFLFCSSETCSHQKYGDHTWVLFPYYIYVILGAEDTIHCYPDLLRPLDLSYCAMGRHS